MVGINAELAVVRREGTNSYDVRWLAEGAQWRGPQGVLAEKRGGGHRPEHRARLASGTGHFVKRRSRDLLLARGCCVCLLQCPGGVSHGRGGDRPSKGHRTLPGWRGRYFHTAHMTFAHYDFSSGSCIHEHFHSEEEVYEVIEGELEVIVDGVVHMAKPGFVAIVPSNVRHSVKALTDGRLIVVDHSARPDFG